MGRVIAKTRLAQHRERARSACREQPGHVVLGIKHQAACAAHGKISPARIR
jgi:hypothetical protein